MKKIPFLTYGSFYMDKVFIMTDREYFEHCVFDCVTPDIITKDEVNVIFLTGSVNYFKLMDFLKRHNYSMQQEYINFDEEEAYNTFPENYFPTTPGFYDKSTFEILLGI